MTNITINTAFDISDTDFLEPKNSYLLPPLPERIRTLIHIEKKQILLKEAIFEKMHKTHQELSFLTSKEVLHKSLYEQTLIMLTKPKKKAYLVFRSN